MSRFHPQPRGRLQPGLIFEVARRAGIEVKESGEKRPIRCPIHDDDHASAFLSVRNVFFCSVCTPGRGMSAREFAHRVGIRWPLLGAPPATWTRPVALTTTSPRVPTFTPALAQRVWATALERAATETTDADREVHAYAERRGLIRARGKGLYGVLGGDATQPPEFASWPRRGYRLLVALHDVGRGTVVNVQARTLREASPKTLVPRGSQVAGTAFANRPGSELLSGRPVAERRVLLGEGLTDFLALAAATEIPVLAAPGTGVAPRAIGPWVRGRELVVALDCDEAGDRAADAVACAAHGLGASRVRRLEWPSGCKDACDVVARRGLGGLDKLLRALLDG